MSNQERDTFKPYLERRYQQANAITYGAKLTIIDQLMVEVKQGRIPISPDQAVKLNPDSTAVKAVREGRAVSLDGNTVAGTAPKTAPAKRNAILALALLSLLPLFGGLWWWASQAEASETTDDGVGIAMVEGIETAPITPTVTATPTLPLPEITVMPTFTPSPTTEPTFTPVPIDEEDFEVDITFENDINNSPIALSFAGADYRVTTAELETTWTPAGVEWWAGTHIRRVFAVPYQDAILAYSFAHVGDTITIRLRTGASIVYQLDGIQQVNHLQIEHLTAIEPSIAIVLYDEGDSQERWLVTGSALQEVGGEMPATSPETTISNQTIVNILNCEQTANRLTCQIEMEADKDPNELILTDRQWLSALDLAPPTTILTISDPISNTLTVQLVGVVNEQPIIKYQDNIQVVPLP